VAHVGFIRHGITDWNIERRAQGQSDIPLNDIGRSQAHALASRLKNELAEWDLIYSSDLSRAKETADIIARMLGLTVAVDTRLRERHCGLLEGTTAAERIERWGEQWESLSFGGEDDEEAGDRGVNFMKELVVLHPGKSVLVVSHGALIRLTLERLLPDLAMDEHLHNTSVTILTNSGTSWECPLYNCAKHIGESA
jgi:2,3-bisphosphoglycerate-dependent phosphoglycerate mutase